MSGSRTKRQIKPSKKYEEYREEHLVPSVDKKYVLRYMDKADVSSLLGEEVYLLWPDDGLWYPAEVIKVNKASNRADVIYTTTDEQEDINLEDLIKDRSIALREARASNYMLKPNEIWDKEDRPDASRSLARSDASEASVPDNSNSVDEEISEGEEAIEEPLGGEEEELEESGRSAKRQKVGEGESSGGRPRRQAALSGKVQQLLAAEKAAYSSSPAQSYKRKSQSPPANSSPHADHKAKDDFSSAEKYEQKIISQISGNAVRVSNQSAQRPESLGQSHFYGSSSGSLLEKQARGKVIEQMTTALSKVAQEDSSGTSLPTVDAVAVKVEEELFKLYGLAGKDYKAKYRSLIFNLRDPNNPDLRRRVLLNEIPAERLVTLTHNELASKQLSQWREEKEAEAMKAAVLDTQAAARFSTAAALASKESGTQETVDWRDNTLATRSPPRDHQPRGMDPEEAMETVDEGRIERMASGGFSQQQKDEVKNEPSPQQDANGELRKSDSMNTIASRQTTTGLAGQTSIQSPSDPKSTAIRSTSFNWSSIRANALQEKAELDTKPKLEALKVEEDDRSEEYDPELEAFDGTTEGPGYKVLANELSIAPSNPASAREKLWHGLLGNACPVPLPVSIYYLAGNQALASGIPPRQADIKGRVQLDKAEDFMKSLKASRSRTLSLGLMRLAEEASEEEKEAMADLERQYIAKERCGVFPEGGIEYYLIARCDLALGLMEACSAGVLPPDHLLVVAVHLKTLVSAPKSPPRAPQQAVVRNSKSPLHPAAEELVADRTATPGNGNGPSTAAQPVIETRSAEEATAADAAQALAAALNTGHHNEAVTDPRLNIAPGSTSAKEEIANQLMMPQGIDLSSLGNLAAFLGVSQGLNLLVDKQQAATSQSQNSGQPLKQDDMYRSYQQHPTPLPTTPFTVSDPRSPSNVSVQASQPLPQQLPGPPSLPGPPEQRPQWSSGPFLGQVPPAQALYQQPVQQYHPGQQFLALPNQAAPNFIPHQQIPPGAYPGPPQQYPQQPDPSAGRYPAHQQMPPAPWTGPPNFQQPQPRPQVHGPRPITLQPPRPSHHPRQPWKPRGRH